MLFELVFIITLGYCVLSLGVEVNCDFDVHAVLLRTVNFAGGTSQFEFDVCSGATYSALRNPKFAGGTGCQRVLGLMWKAKMMSMHLMGDFVIIFIHSLMLQQ